MWKTFCRKSLNFFPKFFHTKTDFSLSFSTFDEVMELRAELITKKLYTLEKWLAERGLLQDFRAGRFLVVVRREGEAEAKVLTNLKAKISEGDSVAAVPVLVGG